MNFILFIACAAFTVRRLMTFLHVFQQEEYDGERFIPWLIENKAFDKRMSAIIIAAFVLSFVVSDTVVGLILIAGFAAVTFFEKNPLTQAKKKLVLTNRAKRILGVAIAITCLSALFFLQGPLLLLLIYIQTLPLSLVLSTYMLQSTDKRVNEKFRQEAVDKLAELNPYVIAVTGSFGKTSVKHILGHILENYAPTLITPGSVNTEMGITRIIRERLTRNHKYFIVEMGAYGIGSIERLCKLTPPKLSIITAIGKAHLERFKDLEGTAKAKYEIAEAAIAHDGKVIINTSVLQREYAKKFTEEHNESFIHCGEGGTYRAENVKQTIDGLTFDLKVGSESYSVLTPIYGDHHVGNILVAVATAHKIGMTIEDIVLTLKNVPQITHRLEVKRQDNFTIIDDAFNSNPKGFGAALDVLDNITPKEGKRILVTPGMVELGEDHDEEHLKLGKKAAETTDITVAVCPERIESFIQGFNEGNANGQSQLIKMGSFKEAEQWIVETANKNDVVLLENDLPDLYEDKIAI